MGKIRIVTDSTFDLPEELVKKYNIEWLALDVRFGDVHYKDRLELKSEDFYPMLVKSDVLPRTSQPSPGEFVELYKRVGEDADTIISIHLSSRLSGTYQSAVQASTLLPEKDIVVVDGRSASAGTGLIVLEAAKAASEGKSKEEILSRVEKVKNSLRIFFTVDTLEYLEKNGRIGPAAAFLGNLLNVKPILAIEEGLVVPKVKVRGSKKVLPKVIELMHEEVKGEGRLRGAILHTGDREESAKWREAIKKEFDFDGELLDCIIGPVIGVHAGPGAIAVATYFVDW